MRHWTVWTLLIVMILAATAELGFRGFRRALSDLQDLSIIYASTRAFATGRNPYDPIVMHAALVEAGRNAPLEANPENLAVYPPTAYLLLSPLALLDWASMRWVWLLINLIAVAVILAAFTLYAPCELPVWKIALVAAFILGFGPIHTAIAKGQPAVIVTSLLALAFVAQTRRAVVVAAVLVGLAACLKPQMVAPVILLYLFQLHWKSIAVVASVTAGLLAVAWLRLSLVGVSWLGLLLGNVKQEMQPRGVYDPTATNPLAFQLMNVSAFFHRLTDNPVMIGFLLAVIAVAFSCFLWKRARHPFDLSADPAAFAAVSVLGLVLLSHRYYDAAVLVFAFSWALRNLPDGRKVAAWITIAGCTIMAFPLSALLIVSGHAQAPRPIPQALWNAMVLQHESWVLLGVLAALTAVLAGWSDSDPVVVATT